MTQTLEFPRVISTTLMFCNDVIVITILFIFTALLLENNASVIKAKRAQSKVKCIFTSKHVKNNIKRCCQNS